MFRCSMFWYKIGPKLILYDMLIQISNSCIWKGNLSELQIIISLSFITYNWTFFNRKDPAHKELVLRYWTIPDEI